MGKRLSIQVISIFAFLLVSIQYAFAWGPLTHITINREAYHEISHADLTYLDNFVMAGHSPDMISFWHIVMGDVRYDYAHNLIDADDGHTILDVDNDEGKNQIGLPVFGKKTLKSYTRTKHPRRFIINDKYFAYGWTGHQLADRNAHGTFGYVASRSLFEGLPPYVKRIGNHGATELIVDAIVYEQNPDIGNYNKLSCSPALLHESAIKYYNETKYSGASSNLVHSIKRSDIITCTRAQRMALLWARWLPVNRMLAKMASLSWWWFPEAKEYYSDYVGKYNQSVEAVASFLNNPTYEIAASQQPFSQGFAFLFNLFKRLKSLFKSEKVQAEEVQENEQLPETLYYTFVNDVAQEAETLGALRTTEQTIVADPNVTGAKSYEFSTQVVNEEAFQQALTTVINRDLAASNPLEKRLWAKFMEGLYLRDDLSFKEITKRAQDFTPPTIANLTPADGSFINNAKPAIHASVVDDLLGIGLDLGSVRMRVNGRLVDHSYTTEINMISYAPLDPLPDGEHRVDLEVSDQAGNQAMSSWIFTVDTIPPEITHEVQKKIINIKKKSKAVIRVSASEKHVSYLMEVFRVKDGAAEGTRDKEGKVDKGEKVYSCVKGVDLPVVDWDGMDDNGQPVANGVYVLRITATDRAGNEASFEEQTNVNNEAGGA